MIRKWNSYLLRNVVKNRFVVIMFCAIIACQLRQIASAQTAYLPQAHAHLLISAEESGNVQKVISKYCSDFGCTTDSGNYPKGFRWITNTVVRFGPDTFFHIGNFRSNDEFELTAYSHEDYSVWHPKWESFLNELKIKFGSNIIN